MKRPRRILGLEDLENAGRECPVMGHLRMVANARACSAWSRGKSSAEGGRAGMDNCGVARVIPVRTDGAHDSGAFADRSGLGHGGAKCLSGKLPSGFLGPCAATTEPMELQPITKSRPVCNGPLPPGGGQSYLSHLGSCGLEAGEVADKVKKGPPRPSGVFDSAGTREYQVGALAIVALVRRPASSEFASTLRGGQRQFASNWPAGPSAT